MRDMWVRGIFFKQVLDHIKKHRGQSALDALNMDPGSYRIEERYDFEDFAKLLAQVEVMAGPENSDFVSSIARDTMSDEARWKVQFRKLDPKSVFMATERQRTRHNLADFETQENGSNHVVIKMSMWTDVKAYQDLWASYYKGRLEGVLKLMGRNGTVSMLKGHNGEYTYEVSWN